MAADENLIRAWTVYEHGGGRYVTNEQRDDWKEPVCVVALADVLAFLRGANFYDGHRSGNMLRAADAVEQAVEAL